MTRPILTYAIMAVFALLPLAGCMEPLAAMPPDNTEIDVSEAMKESLVYIKISAYSFEMLQPWRSADLVERNGFGCAVGPNLVITTALNVADAALIEVRRYGRNEYIPARVKVVDYECNLSLLELDSEAMGEPLRPITFSERYEKGAKLESYWLSGSGDIVAGRGVLDRAKVRKSVASYAQFLEYVAAGTSAESGKGRLFSIGGEGIGIACRADMGRQEAGLITACTINHFLGDVADEEYRGFGVAGFATQSLLDPWLRAELGMSDDMKDGVYVSKVHKLGTACDVLKEGDCILKMGGRQLDAHGRYLDADFERIAYDHIINSKHIGEAIAMEIWRDDKSMAIEVAVRNFKASEMLVPYYEYDKKPEYIVTGGFVIQKLTRNYLAMWGEGFAGKVPPHLYQYYRHYAFGPSDERREIVVLTYVLPAEINLGYHRLGRLVVSRFNGMSITCLADVVAAKALNPDGPFDVIEFEQDSPTVVIPRAELAAADARIAQVYGISELLRVGR